MKDFMPILGVLLGFLLAWLKEYLQNKPKLKFQKKSLNLSHYTGKDINGKEILPSPLGWTHSDLEVLFSVFNVGKASTGIVDFFMDFKVNDQSYNIAPSVEILYEEKVVERGSLNISPGTVETVKVSTKIEYNDKTEIYFQKLDPIDFSVIATDIHGKKHVVYTSRFDWGNKRAG